MHLNNPVWLQFYAEKGTFFTTKTSKPNHLLLLFLFVGNFWKRKYKFPTSDRLLPHLDRGVWYNKVERVDISRICSPLKRFVHISLDLFTSHRFVWHLNINTIFRYPSFLISIPLLYGTTISNWSFLPLLLNYYNRISTKAYSTNAKIKQPEEKNRSRI